MMTTTRRSALGSATLGVVVVIAALGSLTATGASLAAPSRSELDAAKDRLLELERDFEIVVERYNVVQEELEDLRRRTASNELVVRDITKRMLAKQEAASTVAAELYKGGTTGALEVVLTSDTLADVEARLQYLRSSEAAQSRVFERLAADRRVLNDRTARLERAKLRAVEAESRLANLRDEIESKIASQRDEIARLTELIERAERRRELRRRQAAQEAAAAATATPARVAAAPTISLPDAGSRAAVAVQAALAQVGDPYQWGAAGPDSFDCSGLTMYAWAQAGVALPHNSAAQYAATPRVSQSDLQPGDLLFFGSPIHHVGMYIGGGQMVAAPYTGASVRVTSAMRSDFVGAGRPGV
jgi:cell wall-associated NlpC family hydrolase